MITVSTVFLIMVFIVLGSEIRGELLVSVSSVTKCNSIGVNIFNTAALASVMITTRMFSEWS